MERNEEKTAITSKKIMINTYEYRGFLEMSQAFNNFQVFRDRMEFLCRPIFEYILRARKLKPWNYPEFCQKTSEEIFTIIYSQYWKIAEHAINNDFVQWRAKIMPENQKELYWTAISAYRAYLKYLQIYYLMIAADFGNPDRAIICYNRILTCQLPFQTINALTQFGVKTKIFYPHRDFCYQRSKPTGISPSGILAINWSNPKHQVHCSNVNPKRNLSWVADQIAKTSNCYWTEIKMFLGYPNYQLDLDDTLENQYLKLGSVLFFTRPPKKESKPRNRNTKEIKPKPKKKSDQG